MDGAKQSAKSRARYADDGIIHCKTKEEAAERLLGKLGQRFRECGLELHPNKTKIIYCKDNIRTKKYKRVNGRQKQAQN